MFYYLMLRVNAALVILDKEFFQSLMFELFNHQIPIVDSSYSKSLCFYMINLL